jgi:hypothetical protein
VRLRRLIYAAILFIFGDSLAVSSNYFVIIPLTAAALGFGHWGGLAAGLLALPLNLLLFRALGHPEFSPASKLIAEFSGVAVGLVFGFLADYFREIEREIKKRMATEEALARDLSGKASLRSLPGSGEGAILELSFPIRQVDKT